jgi:release factor glutamine methyltransferase
MSQSWRDLYADCVQVLGDRFDARVLVEEVAHQSFAELVAHIDDAAPRETKDVLDDLVTRRRKGEPLQHVIGHWPFRTVELAVDGRALIPRPETEVVVEYALKELHRYQLNASDETTPIVVDLGTGSGAIACSIVSETDDVEVIALDDSASALGLARENSARLGMNPRSRISFFESDAYEAIIPAYDKRIALIVSNPPYIAERKWDALDPVVRDFDPKSALVAGATGLEMIEVVVRGAPRLLMPGSALVVEIAEDQGQQACFLARRAGAHAVEVAPDFTGRDRVLIARW